jgi:hypothetical protein
MKHLKLIKSYLSKDVQNEIPDEENNQNMDI